MPDRTDMAERTAMIAGRKTAPSAWLARIAFGCALIPLSGCEAGEETVRAVGEVVALDPALDRLVDPDARFEILADGLDWCEGPVWVPAGEYLLFSDIPLNRVYRWKEGEGLSVYLEPSGYTGESSRGGESGSNGLLLDPQGRLVLCQHGDRRVARMEAPLHDPEPKFQTLADRYQGKRLNSPNDGIYHSSGDLYFTDPPYGLEKNVDDPAKELDFQGVYRLASGGTLTLLTRGLTRPNGIAFSPDASTLYVANSDPGRALWMAFDLLEDGKLGDGKVFHDATAMVAGRKGLPDGMAVDVEGNLFATGPGGVLIFSAEGKHLGTLDTTQATSNCTFGNDGSMLYVTADRYLLRIPLRTRGLGF